jgi:hypothetical protein
MSVICLNLGKYFVNSLAEKKGSGYTDRNNFSDIETLLNVFTTNNGHTICMAFITHVCS